MCEKLCSLIPSPLPLTYQRTQNSMTAAGKIYNDKVYSEMASKGTFKIYFEERIWNCETNLPTKNTSYTYMRLFHFSVVGFRNNFFFIFVVQFS